MSSSARPARPQTLAMATAAIEMKIPMIAVSPIAPVPPGDGGPWVVQTPQPTPLLVQGIVDHMKAKGLKTVAFIGFSDAFGDLMYNSLEQSAKTADIKIIANERYARSDSSVTAQVLRALAARPDAIMLGGTGTPGALPVIALSERGYKGPLYGNHGLISADFLRLGRQGRQRHHLPDWTCDRGGATSGQQSDSEGGPGFPCGLREGERRGADGFILVLFLRRLAGVRRCRQARDGNRRQAGLAGIPDRASSGAVRDQGASSGRRASTPIRRRIGMASTTARASWSRSRTANTSCCPEAGSMIVTQNGGAGLGACCHVVSAVGPDSLHHPDAAGRALRRAHPAGRG